MWPVIFSLICFCVIHSIFGQHDIRMPPKIVKDPKANFIFRTEDTVTLDCEAEGVPAVEYTWKKNGADLNVNGVNIRGGVHGTITIGPVTRMDEGFYKCFARNQYGTAVSVTSHLQRAVLETKTGTVLEKSVQQGQPFHIQAEPPYSFPKPTYGWEVAKDQIDKQPIPLTTSKRIQIAENGDLYFAYSIPEDDLGGKIYKITSYNAYLDLKAGGSYTNVTIRRAIGESTQFPPSLGFSSDKETVAVVGTNVSLRCFFFGNPTPHVTWDRSGKVLPRGRYQLFNERTEMILRDVIISDEGDYVCSAENDQGRNQSTIHIRVEERPRFKDEMSSPRDVKVTEGDTVTFKCEADGIPEPQITWLRNGEPIDVKTPGNKIHISEDKTILTIENVCRDCEVGPPDLMVIQCNASNVHGYVFASGYLNVLKKTDVILHNESDIMVDSLNEGKIELKCSASSDPLTPPDVTWYRLEKNGRRPVHNRSSIVTVVDGTLTIHITRNITTKTIREQWHDHIGKYVCIGRNGFSENNKSVNVALAPLPVVTTPAPTIFGLPEFWFWVIVAAASFLILLILIICISVCARNAATSDDYNVDGKERWNGLDPAKAALDDGFEEYTRQKYDYQTLKSSRASLSSTPLLKIEEEGSQTCLATGPNQNYYDTSSTIGTASNCSRGYMDREME